MDMLFFLLCGAALLGVLLGLIHPPLVFGRVKGATRKQVLRWYGAATLVCFVGFLVALPPVSTPKPQAEQSAPAPGKPEPAVPAVAEPTKQPEPQPVAQATPPAPVAEAPGKQPEPVASPAAPAPADDAAKLAEERAAREKAEAQQARQAEEARKQAEAEAARKQAETEKARQAKPDVIAYRDRLMAISKETDAGTHPLDVQINAVSRGRGSMTSVYLAASDAKKTVEKGMEAVHGLELPAGLQEEVAKGLKTAASGIWLALMERRDAYEALMSYIDDAKPSDMLKFKEKVEESDKHALLAALALSDTFTKAGIPWESSQPKSNGKAKPKRNK